jgi:hypothetical protein
MNCCPSTLLTGSTPPPLPCVNTHRVCIYTGGGRGSGCVESIYRSYTLCIWPDSELTKLLYHRKQKPRWGEGATDKHLPPSPFAGQFFKKSRHLWLESISYLVPGLLEPRPQKSNKLLPDITRQATALSREREGEGNRHIYMYTKQGTFIYCQIRNFSFKAKESFFHQTKYEIFRPNEALWNYFTSALNEAYFKILSIYTAWTQQSFFQSRRKTKR